MADKLRPKRTQKADTRRTRFGVGAAKTDRTHGGQAPGHIAANFFPKREPHNKLFGEHLPFLPRVCHQICSATPTSNADSIVSPPICQPGSTCSKIFAPQLVSPLVWSLVSQFVLSTITGRRNCGVKGDVSRNVISKNFNSLVKC